MVSEAVRTPAAKMVMVCQVGVPKVESRPSCGGAKWGAISGEGSEGRALTLALMKQGASGSDVKSAGEGVTLKQQGEVGKRVEIQDAWVLPQLWEGSGVCWLKQWGGQPFWQGGHKLTLHPPSNATPILFL